MTNEEILNELKKISDKADEICKNIFESTTPELGLRELSELKKISDKADELCENVFDLKIAILGNWRKVADNDLPRVSGYVIAVYDVDDCIEGRSRVIHEVFYDAEQKKFFGVFETELDIIAWVELPIYNKK